MGLFGALFAVASIVGPLMGGAFAGKLQMTSALGLAELAY